MQKSPAFRSKEHREFVARQVCCVCARPADDAHHPRIGVFGRNVKIGDDKTVPLCRWCHTTLHDYGTGERAFWRDLGADPDEIAEKLWAISPANKGGRDAI